MRRSDQLSYGHQESLSIGHRPTALERRYARIRPMSSPSRVESIATTDGQHFDGQLFLPPSGRGSGVLLLQEIFGVGEFLVAKADDLAALGYVVLCPDVF